MGPLQSSSVVATRVMGVFRVSFRVFHSFPHQHSTIVTRQKFGMLATGVQYPTTFSDLP
jgi:hypothetical protein